MPFSEDLSIRLITHADLPDIISMLNDDRVNQYLYFASAEDISYTDFFNPIIENIKHAVENNYWADSLTFVIHDESERYMGMCAITQVSFLAGNYEVGYQLPVHAWKQGIATAACQLMIKLGFEELNAHKICADCYAQNIGSCKTLEKSGFVREGHQKDYYRTAKGVDDRLLYGITATSYKLRAAS